MANLGIVLINRIVFAAGAGFIGARCNEKLQNLYFKMNNSCDCEIEHAEKSFRADTYDVETTLSSIYSVLVVIATIYEMYFIKEKAQLPGGQIIYT